MALMVDQEQLRRQRAAARRTAAWLALVAALIFGAFVLSGVIGK